MSRTATVNDYMGRAGCGAAQAALAPSVSFFFWPPPSLGGTEIRRGEVWAAEGAWAELGGGGSQSPAMLQEALSRHFENS